MSELRFSINPESFYSEEALRAMGLTTAVIKKAVDKGELRCRVLGKRQRVYRGQWVIDWLEGGKP